MFSCLFGAVIPKTIRNDVETVVENSCGSAGVDFVMRGARWMVCAGVLGLALLLAAPAFGGAPQRGGHGRGGGFAGFRAQENRGHAPRFQNREHQGMRPNGGRDFRQNRQDGRARQQEMRQENRREMRQAGPSERRSNGPSEAHGSGPSGSSGNRPAYRPETNPAGRPDGHSGERRGQEHLPQWWQQHRGLSPQQQVDALRRQPGFRSLPRGQQQRLINRLHDFDRRSPREQQRTLGRVEMFERLSPERKQQVRGASQALSRMSPVRQREMRQAFRELRQMPPDERQQRLHSAYGTRFTPQERTVLGNLLSIEPYQGPQGQQQQIPQPYFGRR